MKTTLRLELLISPLFILGLSLLLLNDFYLKSNLANAFSGKLSDFAGMFISPLFLLALFPKRKLLSFISAGLFFVYWKSPLSEGFIELFNTWGLGLGRVVDYSDLWALLMLPMAWNYEGKARPIPRLSSHILLLLTLFAFCATSMPPRKFVTYDYADIDKVYEFPYSQELLVRRLNQIALDHLRGAFGYWSHFDAASNSFLNHRNDTIAKLIDESKLREQHPLTVKNIFGSVEISGSASRSKLKLLRLSAYEGPSKKKKDYREDYIRLFEKKIIKKLRKEPPYGY